MNIYKGNIETNSISSGSCSSGNHSNDSNSICSSTSSSSTGSSSCSNCPSINSDTNSTLIGCDNCHSTNINVNPASNRSNISKTVNSSIGSKSNNFYSFKHNYLPICNKITIDVAVLCQEYTKIEKMCDDHIINLDEIEITKELFQCIFYPYYENFGINKNAVCNNCLYSPYISFLPEYRTVNGKKFYLLEEIISNIESDLNISRNCFTVESLVELTNEIISINSFCDINCCSVLASLTWCNILEIIQNYSAINDNCGGCSSGSTSTSSSGSILQPVIPICVISIIFKTPTPGVKNTIVRFNYRITDL